MGTEEIDNRHLHRREEESTDSIGGNISGKSMRTIAAIVLGAGFLFTLAGIYFDMRNTISNHEARMGGIEKEVSETAKGLQRMQRTVDRIADKLGVPEGKP